MKGEKFAKCWLLQAVWINSRFYMKSTVPTGPLTMETILWAHFLALVVGTV